MLYQFGVEEASKVILEPFITTDELVAEAETRHESVLFEPGYGAERAREENVFDSGKCKHAFGKTGIDGVAPLESPVGFALDTWYCFGGVEHQVQFLLWILDVRVNEERVLFVVDVFDCNLEVIAAAGFGCCDFGGEISE